MSDDMISTLAEQADALAAKDAEIERLRRDLDLAAQHAAAADSECERRIAAHQAAEAEVARLKNLNVLQAHLLSDANRRARDERERVALLVDEWLATPTMKLRAGEMTAQEVRTAKAVVTAIAAAIRAG